MVKRLKKVLVLGATGHIGQGVVRHALANGREVTAVTRRDNPVPLRDLDVKTVRIDGDLRSLAKLAAGHDLLVDAAAPYPLAPDMPSGEIWRAQVDAAVKRMGVVMDAARVNKIRLVYVSSCTTLPRQESRSEAAAALWRRSLSPYFEAKAAMERAVIAAAREGLEAVIVNPAACIGPWEFRAVERSLVGQVLAERLPIVISRTMCVIDVRDVSDAIDRALSQELYGRPIPLSGHNIDLAEFVLRTRKLAGLTPQLPLPIHPTIVSSATYWMQMAFIASGTPPPEGLDYIPLIADSIAIPRSPEQIALGVTIRPLDQTLLDAIAFHRQRQAG